MEISRVEGNLERFPAAMGFDPRDPRDFPRAKAKGNLGNTNKIPIQIQIQILAAQILEKGPNISGGAAGTGSNCTRTGRWLLLVVQ